MKCLGTTTLTRACHFQDVYYDLSSKHFVYFGPDGAAPELFGRSHDPSEPWLRLIRGITRYKAKKEKAKQFFLDWRGGEPPPPAADVAPFTQPLHLRSTMNTRSFGHLLRDNLQSLIDLPIRFGRDPVAFDWVRWHTDIERSPWQTESTAAMHYRGLLNKRPSLTWQEVIDGALKGKPRGVKYIRFSEIIAGQGPADLVSHVGRMALEADDHKMAAWAHMCDPFAFSEMRAVAYRNYGLKVASAPDLDPFVLFMDGQAREKRHLVNADALIPKLRKTFPGVRMEHVMISKRPLEGQLALLSKATVVVTNIGSRSFRLIYLPNGATTILVGPPEYQLVLPPAKKGGPLTHDRVPMPFQEIESCWGYIGYVNMLQYHVESEAEVPKEERSKWKTWKNARDSDIILDEAKITALLRVALQRDAGGGAFAGSGTLAAYEP